MWGFFIAVENLKFVESFEISSYLLDFSMCTKISITAKFEGKKIEFNIHELFANKTPKHPSKLKKKKKEPSILKPTYRDKWVTSSSFDHWTEITFQQYKVHHSSSSYFCLTWTMSTKLSKQKKTTMSFRRKLKKIKKKYNLHLFRSHVHKKFLSLA